jgi:hypothetical protein
MQTFSVSSLIRRYFPQLEMQISIEDDQPGSPYYKLKSVLYNPKKDQNYELQVIIDSLNPNRSHATISELPSFKEIYNYPIPTSLHRRNHRIILKTMLNWLSSNYSN